MKYESYLSLKHEILNDQEAQAMRALVSSEDLPPVTAIGLSKGKKADDFRLAIRSENAQEAARIAEKAAGEADVRIIEVMAQPNPAHFQSQHVVLEPGLEIQPEGQNWMGTLGAFVRHRVTGEIGFLSNAHVLTDMGRLPKGTRILHPARGRVIGSVVEDVPVSVVGSNFCDAAWAVLAKGERFLGSFTAGVGRLAGLPRLPTPDDLGAPVAKDGRTTGSTAGVVSAIDLDSLVVNYGGGRRYAFDNQMEFTAGPTRSYSMPGDSGSLISFASGRPLAHLFAGGNDQEGQAFTFGAPILVPLNTLDLDLL